MKEDIKGPHYRPFVKGNHEFHIYHTQGRHRAYKLHTSDKMLPKVNEFHIYHT